ncbi:MAG TPA: hypothetical protein VLP43_05310, partial [Solirubrobacteraceae bacterium]|nr:hypothetical protein [Solirubrobacteraceae bacterium]
MDRPDQPDQQDRRAVGADHAEQVRAPGERPLSSTTPPAAGQFSFVQIEAPWLLGPTPGRYLVRAPDGTGSPTHGLVIAELGAPERRRLRRSRRPAEPQPEPAPVSTGRATIIDLVRALPDAAAAEAWLQTAGEAELETALALLNRALHGLRLILADPDRHEVAREQLLVARVGYGGGEEVADGLWSEARELVLRPAHQSRQRVLQPQARLAAMLAGRERALVCEELTLR